MIGVNKNFIVEFDSNTQKYNVTYKGKFLISAYNFKDVKSYLD